MPEPTIEGWNALTDCPRCGALAYIGANTEGEGILIARTDAEIIRAFVERVEKRLPDYNTGKGADSWLKAYRVAVMDELADMEKA
jgi:hypothetical protein